MRNMLGNGRICRFCSSDSIVVNLAHLPSSSKNSALFASSLHWTHFIEPCCIQLPSCYCFWIAFRSHLGSSLTYLRLSILKTSQIQLMSFYCFPTCVLRHHLFIIKILPTVNNTETIVDCFRGALRFPLLAIIVMGRNVVLETAGL